MVRRFQTLKPLILVVAIIAGLTLQAKQGNPGQTLSTWFCTEPVISAIG